MHFQIYQTISAISLFIYCLLAFFLLTTQSPIKRANNFLALFLLFISVDIAASLLPNGLNGKPFTNAFRIVIAMLQLPLFLLYIRIVCFVDFKLRSKHFWHGVTFLISIIALLFQITVFRRHNVPVLNYPSDDFSFVLNMMLKIQSGTYLFLIFRQLNYYKKNYLQNYSQQIGVTYIWLRQISFLILAAHFLLFSKILAILLGIKLIGWVTILVTLMSLILVCFIVLKALRNPEIFRGVLIFTEKNSHEIAVNNKLLINKDNFLNSYIAENEPNIHPYDTTGSDTPISNLIPDKTAEAKLNDDEIQSRIDNLLDWMVEKQPFLEPSLTIQNLASQLNLPTTELSGLINNHLNKRFFDFINEYRIKKAVEFLQNTSKKEFSIKEIYYEVGFNSKSSFNTAFKKYTCKTPKEYREFFKK
jgi:AraC-like DNA-binding protein